MKIGNRFKSDVIRKFGHTNIKIRLFVDISLKKKENYLFCHFKKRKHEESYQKQFIRIEFHVVHSNSLMFNNSKSF